MKPIQSASDLAVNGAPPAFAHPLHVGRPNLGSYEKFAQYAKDIFSRNWLTNNGPLVQELEKRIESYLNVNHCIAMCSGTVALEIAIRALQLEGEVILPSFTFIATAHALSWQAITPVFADIDPITHNLDPVSVRSMITPRTSGIIGVHLWGRPAPIDELQRIADDHNLQLLFDAAHAFGCSHNKTMIGNFGQCEVFSFHATKFFNTFEGGAIVTNDDSLADAVRLMRNFGFEGEDNVIHPGTNGKMMEVAAAMGLVNLDSINSVIEHNQLNYQTYKKELANLPNLNVLTYNPPEQHNYQYIVIEVSDNSPVDRNQLVKILHTENIKARKYFWPGCHKMKPYREYYPHAGVLLPITETVAEKVLLLPTGLEMNRGMVQTVCSIIKTILNNCEKKPHTKTL